MGKLENDLGDGDDTVGTPEYILEPIRQLAPIGFDPCSHPRSIVPAHTVVLLPLYRLTHPGEVPVSTIDVIYGDGLDVDWGCRNEMGLVFWNPPYSELDRWLAKGAKREALESVGFVPIRSGNVGWAPATTADVRCDLPRVTHRGCKVHAPFHQCLLYFAQDGVSTDRLIEVVNVFSQLGAVTINPKHLVWKNR